MTPEATAGKTIMVVEDNAVVREGLGVLLGQGFIVVLMPNGQEALDYLAQGQLPDLILLDLLMPVLDGWAFLKLVKQIDRAASVPIVIITGTSLTREWAVANGCAGLIAKPIETDALLEEIRRCLGTA